VSSLLGFIYINFFLSGLSDVSISRLFRLQ
jgi:hypothetical protein